MVGHYEVRSRIGAGGMGEVYLAMDTRLDRLAALKVLPAAVAADRDRMSRFVQEAKAAAALNHPNIAHIYDIGDSDGTNFIAMEYVDGPTLTKVFSERAPLEKVLRYLQHVAEGLSKAHTAGIVHRDLKPDNIMITPDGHAKILDFGLAKLVSGSAEPARTGSDDATAILPHKSTPGTILGTAGYMSPEQAQGKTASIDHRSDIFSFGCILFEAVTGRRPFEGADAIDTLNKVIREPAPAVSSINPNVPTDLQRIIRRCLAKDPDDRYQSVRDVAIELRELRRDMSGGEIDVTAMPLSDSETKIYSHDTAGPVGTHSRDSAVRPTHMSSAEYIVSGIKSNKTILALVALTLIASSIFAFWYFRNSASAQIDSIAVMPFVNASGNAEFEYLSDGMTESLINSLSHIQGLNVKSRSSVFRYKGKETDAQQIAGELGVQAVLSGRLMPRGENLLLSLELVDARTGNQIWGEQYNRKAADLVTLQGDIARDIFGKLRNKFAAQQPQATAGRDTKNTEAFQLYLKGRYHWNKRNIADIRKSIEYFQEAIEKDPGYALAHAGLADAYVVVPSYSVNTHHDAFPKARSAAQRALQIDDTLAQAHVTLADILYEYDWKFEESERQFKRAIELDPNYATAYHWYGELLMVLGRTDEALAVLRTAQEKDPLSMIINSILGVVHNLRGERDLAIQQLKKTIEMDPNFPRAHLFLGEAYEDKGMYEEAAYAFEKHLVLTGAPQDKAARDWGAIRAAFKSGGREGYYREQARLLERQRSENIDDAPPLTVMAGIYARLGDKDKAFELLERSIQLHEPDLIRMKNPGFANLFSDPRYADLVRRIGLPQ